MFKTDSCRKVKSGDFGNMLLLKIKWIEPESTNKVQRRGMSSNNINLIGHIMRYDGMINIFLKKRKEEMDGKDRKNASECVSYVRLLRM